MSTELRLIRLVVTGRTPLLFCRIGLLQLLTLQRFDPTKSSTPLSFIRTFADDDRSEGPTAAHNRDSCSVDWNRWVHEQDAPKEIGGETATSTVNIGEPSPPAENGAKAVDGSLQQPTHVDEQSTFADSIWSGSACWHSRRV